MKKTIVIGGGIIGVATLHELAVRGVEAVLLEAESELATGASYANGGMMTPSMPDPWNSPGVWRHLVASVFDPYAPMKLRLSAAPGLARWGLEFLRNSSSARHLASSAANFVLASYSAAATREIADLYGFDFDRSTTGTLKIFSSTNANAGPLALARRLEPLGLRFVELDRQGVIEKEPRLRPVAETITGGIQYPDDFCGDSRIFTLALAEAAKAKGGVICVGERVESLIRDGHRVTGVKLASGESLVGDVVLAAGLSSVKFASQCGLRLPLRPAKGYSLTIDVSEARANVPEIAVIDDAMHAAVVPLGRRIRLVGTAEFAGDDSTIRPARIDNLFRLLERTFPDLARGLDRRMGKAWAGLRPMSVDGRPFIGPAPSAGLWFNCGHGHLGWTMAAGSARLLASLMSGEVPRIDSAPYQFGEKRSAERRWA